MKILIACVLVTGVSGLGSLVSAQTTLAEASEAAKKIHHEWPVSTNHVPVFDPANAVPVTDVLAASPVPEESAAIVPPVKQDEAWWKTHMGGLRDKVATDAAVCEPLAAKILALPIRCEVNPHTKLDNVWFPVQYAQPLFASIAGARCSPGHDDGRRRARYWRLGARG